VRRGDELHVALLVDGPAVFIGTQIDPQVEQLAADYARHLWKRVTPINTSSDGHNQCRAEQDARLSTIDRINKSPAGYPDQHNKFRIHRIAKPSGLRETEDMKKPELTDTSWLGPRDEMDRASHLFGKCSECHEIICVEKALTDGPRTRDKRMKCSPKRFAPT
jgi:hypothetical protein